MTKSEQLNRIRNKITGDALINKAIGFNVGDKVEAKENSLRLKRGTIYEVLKITKQGHIVIQTPDGKTHYAQHKFTQK